MIAFSISSRWRERPLFTALSVTSLRTSSGSFALTSAFSMPLLPTSASSMPAAAPATMPAGPALTIATPPPPHRLAPTTASTTPISPERISMPIASSSESFTPESPASTFAPVRLIRSGGTPQRTQSVVSSFSSVRISSSSHACNSPPMRSQSASPAKAFEIFRSTFLFSASMVSTPPLRQSRTASSVLSCAMSNSALATGSYSSCALAFTAT